MLTNPKAVVVSKQLIQFDACGGFGFDALEMACSKTERYDLIYCLD
ncbi:MAG: hypothetical protein WCA63_09470 [Gallionella sp.]